MSGRSFDMVRKQAPQKKVDAKPVPKKRIEAPRKGPSLRERRERARSRFGFLLLFLMVLCMGAVVYGFWRPEVRVSEIQAKDLPDEEKAVSVLREVIDGKYLGILPRDSIFFYPEEEAITALLHAFPSLESVSIGRNSFSALSIEGVRREVGFLWCGESAVDFSIDSKTCYEADEAGFVFAPHLEAYDPALFPVYGALSGERSGADPVGASVVGAKHLLTLLLFVEGIKELGVPVLGVYIKDDEAELFVTPETRLIYVLGNEEEAIESAKAALEDLNLLNGSIEYVDLRFSGKLYVKRYE